MMITGVIFDMDGVLVDSEPIYFELNQAMFRHFGFEVTAEEHNSFVGYPSRKIWAYLSKSRGKTLNMEEVMNHEADKTRETFSEANLEPMPGLTNLLEILTGKGIPLSVASSSAPKTIELVTRKIGVQNYFNHLVSGQQVKNGKPAPDIFLYAAKLLGLKPESCMVIEDSRNGARAAKSAGMVCIGYQNPNSGNQDLSICDTIIDRFDSDGINSILRYLTI